MLETVVDLVAAFGEARELVIARELTKKFEEVARLALGEARAWVEGNPHRQQGEFVLVLGPRPAAVAEDDGESERVLRILLEDHSVSDSARIAARITGASKNALYEKALALPAATAPGKPRKPR